MTPLKVAVRGRLIAAYRAADPAGKEQLATEIDQLAAWNRAARARQAAKLAAAHQRTVTR